MVAVDPTSTLTGGAILGDRIRMGSVYGDPEVFVRSMATQGRVGGLSLATMGAVRVLDAAGKDIVIVETVGVGQDEVDVASSAYTTLLVEVPGLGDDIQTIKAGIIEVADILVLNKADREGADQLLAQLRHSMSLSMPEPDSWKVPILRTVATKGEGLEGLVRAIDRHRDHLASTGLLERKRRELAAKEILALIHDQVERDAQAVMDGVEYEATIDEVVAHHSDTYSEAQSLLHRLYRHEPTDK